MVKITNLSKKYGEKQALDHLSVQFEEGKVTGLLGPNGAGKSTLLKMMVGLVKPDEGEIEILGKAPSVKLNANIAYLPDRAGWYKFQSVSNALKYAEVIFPDFNLNTANLFLEQMKLDPDMKVAKLSRGEQACLQLSFCLARNVPLCLLDEPFSGIDLISRERIIAGIIDAIAVRGQTIIICTHEINDAESLFDKAVFLNEGRLIENCDVEMLRKNGDSVENIYRRLYR